MSQNPKLKCPRCGADMNHHAMKVDYGVDDWEKSEPAFDGVLEEVHGCPQCWHIELKVTS